MLNTRVHKLDPHENGQNDRNQANRSRRKNIENTDIFVIGGHEPTGKKTGMCVVVVMTVCGCVCHVAISPDPTILTLRIHVLDRQILRELVNGRAVVNNRFLRFGASIWPNFLENTASNSNKWPIRTITSQNFARWCVRFAKTVRRHFKGVRGI